MLFRSGTVTCDECETGAQFTLELPAANGAATAATPATSATAATPAT